MKIFLSYYNFVRRFYKNYDHIVFGQFPIVIFFVLIPIATSIFAALILQSFDLIQSPHLGIMGVLGMAANLVYMLLASLLSWLTKKN